MPVWQRVCVRYRWGSLLWDCDSIDLKGQSHWAVQWFSNGITTFLPKNQRQMSIIENALGPFLGCVVTKMLASFFCCLVTIWFYNFEHVQKFCDLTGDVDKSPTFKTSERVLQKYPSIFRWLIYNCSKSFCHICTRFQWNFAQPPTSVTFERVSWECPPNFGWFVHHCTKRLAIPIIYLWLPASQWWKRAAIIWDSGWWLQRQIPSDSCHENLQQSIVSPHVTGP